jgi:hypothetical protein
MKKNMANTKNHLHSCPKCGCHLTITRYDCSNCGTRIEGEFLGCPFCQLDEEDRLFALIFIQTEGNMKDVERLMGISYPTVKSRLARLNHVLRGEVPGISINNNVKISELSVIPNVLDRSKILDRLASGDITPTEAAKLLRGEI